MSPPPNPEAEVAVAEAVALEETHAGIGQAPMLLIIRGLTAMVIVTSIVLGAHFYIGHRIFDASGLPTPIISALWVAMWGAFLSIFAGFLGGRFLPRKLALVPTWVGFMWMGAFGLLLVTAAASDVLVAALSLVLERTPHWQQVQAWAIPGVVGPVLLLGVRAARGTLKL